MINFKELSLFESIDQFFDAEITFPEGDVKYGVFSRKIESDIKKVVDSWNLSLDKLYKGDKVKVQDASIHIGGLGKGLLRREYTDMNTGKEFTRDSVTFRIKDIKATTLIAFTKYWKKYNDWGNFPILITHESEKSKIISDGKESRKLS